MRSLTAFLLVLIVTVYTAIPVVFGSPGEVDATTVVSRVIDGDTFDTTSEGRVRMADIDAPESGESGYSAAKECLEDLIDGKTVYLDIDDVYRTDPYGRLVCVVYVRHSSTQFKNVNKALLVEGVAWIDNYNNEFNPYSWTLYVDESEIPEFPLWAILPMSMIASLLVALVIKRRKNIEITRVVSR